MHGALTLGNAADDGKTDVKNGQAQHQERHGKGDDRVGLEQAENGDAGQHKAQKSGAGVAHKNGGGIKVIGNKAHTGAHQRRQQDRADHGCRIRDQQQGDDEHSAGGNGRNACRQTVQAVDEVDGVGDGDDPDDRHGVGQPIRQGKAHKMLDAAAVKDYDDRRCDLHAEFRQGRQGQNVVHHAQDHDDDRAQKNTLQLGAHVQILEDQDADDEAQEDSKAAHSGNGDMVHPALVLGDVHSADLFRQHLDQRRQRAGNHSGADQCQTDLQQKIRV